MTENIENLDDFQRALQTALGLFDGFSAEEKCKALEVLSKQIIGDSSRDATADVSDVKLEQSEAESLANCEGPKGPLDRTQGSSRKRKTGRPKKLKQNGLDDFIDDDEVDVDFQSEETEDASYKPPRKRRKQKIQLVKPFKRKVGKTKMQLSDKIKLVKGDSARTKCIRHACVECGDRFSHGKPLKAHLRSHADTGPCCCVYCRKLFASHVHMRQFHGPVCRHKFLKYPSGREIPCTECGERFRRFRPWYEHMKATHGMTRRTDNEFICRTCKKEFSKRKSLFIHCRSHHPDKVVCLQCGDVLETDESYQEHLTHHQEEDQRKRMLSNGVRYQCDDCKAKFPTKRLYKRHVREHGTSPNKESEARYTCEHCEMTFSQKRVWMKHLSLSHGVRYKYPHELKRYDCTQCDRHFPRPGLLDIHYRIHTGEKPIECVVCHQFFRTTKALKKHEESKTHKERAGFGDLERERNYLCTICGKAYFRRKDLSRHAMTHDPNSKKFSCPHCEYRCAENHRLKIHMQLHYDSQRKFVCEECGASFHQKASLQEHKAFKHSDEYNFVCSEAECGKKFKRQNGLRRHTKTHLSEDEKPYTCPGCNKKFDRMTNLRRHLLNVHKTIDGVPKKKTFIRLDQHVSGYSATKTGSETPQVSASSDVITMMQYDPRSTPHTQDTLTPQTLTQQGHSMVDSTGLIYANSGMPDHISSIASPVSLGLGPAPGHPTPLAPCQHYEDSHYAPYYIVPVMYNESKDNYNSYHVEAQQHYSKGPAPP